MKLTIAAMKRRNAAQGEFWFSEGAMSFFNTKIESEPSEKGYFITSEYMDDPSKKRYTIRLFDQKTDKVETVGDFRKYDTLKEAIGDMQHVD